MTFFIERIYLDIAKYKNFKYALIVPLANSVQTANIDNSEFNLSLALQI